MAFEITSSTKYLQAQEQEGGREIGRKTPQYAIFCHHKGQGTNLAGSTASLPFPKAATMMTEYGLIGEFEVKLRWQFERDVCSHPAAATMWYYGLASY